MSTFANSEDPDNAAFHQDIHCKGKGLHAIKRIHYFFTIIT